MDINFGKLKKKPSDNQFCVVVASIVTKIRSEQKRSIAAVSGLELGNFTFPALIEFKRISAALWLMNYSHHATPFPVAYRYFNGTSFRRALFFSSFLGL